MQSWMVRRLALGSIAGLGVAAEPVAEARRSKSRVFTRGEALIVHVYAVVERAGVGDNLSCVPGCGQELPHEVVLPNRFGTGQIKRAVQWRREIGRASCRERV